MSGKVNKGGNVWVAIVAQIAVLALEMLRQQRVASDKEKGDAEASRRKAEDTEAQTKARILELEIANKNAEIELDRLRVRKLELELEILRARSDAERREKSEAARKIAEDVERREQDLKTAIRVSNDVVDAVRNKDEKKLTELSKALVPVE